MNLFTPVGEYHYIINHVIFVIESDGFSNFIFLLIIQV